MTAYRFGGREAQPTPGDDVDASVVAPPIPEERQLHLRSSGRVRG
jgi:hypothetical protein